MWNVEICLFEGRQSHRRKALQLYHVVRFWVG